MTAPDTFSEFVASRYPALVRTARLLVADAHAAEDLVQETLARCVPAWSRIEGNPEAYVRTVMVRQNISRWRRRRVGETTVAVVPDVAVRDGDVAEQDELRRALAALPARQRAVVVLRYVEDRPEREVADVLGCSLGTVKSQAHAGLAKLRTFLAEHEVDASPEPAASLFP
ncbi:SigE family RNA polymerase sigma factor [Nocardioides jishulii]|uniref:SigE family RNA polymerase sigma factor n=1 Tax=Nocardioides jishulii TaxID=2575440 RepID=A0A4U2YMD4_9ACTN|nr:SigE family RNA polymerase sigma factor [Nocardioides jishulii]QCX27268.1 SigE family RNA polymerase sigma factor [Nocardioides jishulii]TKI61755.1 SigE family RNA polymerase sigma factor [Nocardioides jishulii]